MYVRQSEMAGVSFKPQLTPAAASASSVLRVTSEPHTYVERVQHQTRAKDLKRTLTKQIIQQNQEKECTFRPIVHDSPDYVKKIAHRYCKLAPRSLISLSHAVTHHLLLQLLSVVSVKAAKALAAAQRPPPPPTWK
jgi:hypothetical protein